jgi:hypothetical protein
MVVEPSRETGDKNPRKKQKKARKPKMNGSQMK